jgi:filamentous hemagglutinin
MNHMGIAAASAPTYKIPTFAISPTYRVEAGREVTKHPEYFGFNSTNELRAIYRTDAEVNKLGSDALREILIYGDRTTGAGGRYPAGWITYTLDDGRAASWTKSGEFIGFRGVQK